MLTNKEIKEFIDSKNYSRLTYRLNRRYAHGGTAHWLVSFGIDQFYFDTLESLECLCDAYIRARDILSGSIQVDNAITFTSVAPLNNDRD